jgi:hypothetical protein
MHNMWRADRVSTRACLYRYWVGCDKTRDQFSGQDADQAVGASNGRGPRCSGWFADYITEQGNDRIQSLTLGGGIKGWVKAGEPYIQHMEGFEPGYWKQFD